MNKPYTGIEGNKIIGDLISDINDILIDLTDEGWYTDVSYSPNRWESDENQKVINDSINVIIKKKQNRVGSKYPSNGSIFNIQDIREYIERIGDMFSDNQISARTCKPEGHWGEFMFGKWSSYTKRYHRVITSQDNILAIDIKIHLRGRNMDQNENIYTMKYLKLFELYISDSEPIDDKYYGISYYSTNRDI